MSELDDLLQEGESGMARIVRRMRERAAKWDLEEEALGAEDPEVLKKREVEEDRAAAAEPVVDAPSRRSWREEFLRNWPDKPKWKRGGSKP